MATIATLSVSLTARTSKFVKGIRGATRSLLGFSKASKNASFSSKIAASNIRALASIAGPAAAVAGFVKLTRAVEDFDRAMLGSLAIMGDVRTGLQETMRQTAIDVARVTVFSAQEAAKAYFFLASAGLKAEQAIAALPFVAKFAQAGMFDLSLATDLVTDAQSALGLTVDDVKRNMVNMRRVADTLVKANTLANASVQQFSEALTNKAGASLKIINKDIEEGVAVLAAFADQGIKSSDAGTALSIVLRDLSTKSIKFSDKFERAGIAVFNTEGNMRNLADIIGDVENALAGLNDIQAKATLLQLGFSDKSVIFIQTLIGMSDRIREYEKELRKAGGTTETVASKQMTPMQEAMAELNASFIDAGQNLRPFVEGLADLTKGMTSFLKTAFEFVAFDDLFSKGFSFSPTTQPLRDAKGRPTNLSANELRTVADIQARFNKLTKDGAFDYGVAADKALELSAAIDSVAESTGNNGFVFSEASRAVDTFGEKLDKLKEKMQNVGATDKTLEKLKLLELFSKTGGLGDVEALREALNLVDTIKRAEDALDNMNKSQREASRLFDRTRNPFEIHNTNMEKYIELLKEGFISQDTFNRAVKQSKDILDKTLVTGLSRAKSGEARQISLSRFGIGGLSGRANKPQPIVSKQIDKTNALLQQVVMNTFGPTEGVFAA